MEAELRCVLAEALDDLRRRRLSGEPAFARRGDGEAPRQHAGYDHPGGDQQAPPAGADSACRGRPQL